MATVSFIVLFLVGAGLVSLNANRPGITWGFKLGAFLILMSVADLVVLACRALSWLWVHAP